MSVTLNQGSPALPVSQQTRRLRAMLEGPIGATVIRLAWPNLLMMMAQSSTGLIEMWYVSRLGSDALAGTALVTPILMLMQTMSQGAMGGGISSAIARALGAKKTDEANSLVLNAVLINCVLGILFSALLILGGPGLYRALGGVGASLDAAVAYSNVIFAGAVLMWVMNALASAIRGSGNMLVPGLVISGGALLLVPLSPCLIFGIGPFPRLGVAGAGAALVVYYALGLAVLAWYCISGRNAARLQAGPVRWKPIKEILAVGGLAVINPIQMNAVTALITAILGAQIGVSAVAGYGIGVRLELLLLPMAFGIGAPLVALVASNIGAKQEERAKKIALVGAAIAFAISETLGIAAAIWPRQWLELFSTDPEILRIGITYLQIVGPFYGFFGMGFSLYFAAQGARRLKWPLWAAFVRLVTCTGIGYLVLASTGSIKLFFAVSALGMVLYGTIVLIATMSMKTK